MKYLLLALLLIPTNAMSADYWVDDGGDDSDNTACTACPCSTAYDEIEDATNLNVLTGGDTVHVCGGTYTTMVTSESTEDGSAGSPITWQCETGETCTLNVSANMQWRNQGLSYHTIDGFTFTGESANDYKVNITSSDNITIQNCAFSGGTNDMGIIVDNAGTTDNTDINILNNTFTTNNDFLRFNFPASATAVPLDVVISGNIGSTTSGRFVGTIFQNGASALAHLTNGDLPSGITITNNLVTSTVGAGIDSFFWNEGGRTNLIARNTLQNIGDGTVQMNAYNVHYAKSLIIEHNVCDTVTADTSDGSCYIVDYADQDLSGTGEHTWASDGVVVRYNVARNCDSQRYSSGFLVWSGTDTEFYGNYATDCSVGLRISNPESTGTVAYRNILTNNSNDNDETVGERGDYGSGIRLSDPDDDTGCPASTLYDNIMTNSVQACLFLANSTTAIPTLFNNSYYNCGTNNKYDTDVLGEFDNEFGEYISSPPTYYPVNYYPN